MTTIKPCFKLLPHIGMECFSFESCHYDYSIYKIRRWILISQALFPLDFNSCGDTGGCTWIGGHLPIANDLQMH